MSKADLQQPSGNLRGEGMDEANPIRFDGAFFRTNGVKSQFGATERLEGKLFLSNYEEPIVAVHSNDIDKFWIQTPTTLFITDDLTDLP